MWAYYVRAFPGLRPPDRDVLAVFCEQIVLFRDLQAALRDYPPGSAEAMRIRRDLKSATVEIRQYAHALGFTPKSREHLTAPEPPTPDLEDWMRP